MRWPGCARSTPSRSRRQALPRSGSFSASVAEVVFSARALASLRRVRTYLLQRNPAAATRVIAEIERACALIGDYPQMGPAISGTGLRRHVTRHDRYRAIYRVEGGSSRCGMSCTRVATAREPSPEGWRD
ncbi:type II toxin-antitoxin system RelE/ParE family toxin [uncultured Amaricoccus sp.]|uniref:type II toxin-antitoxin system RelE/ParE family toxin n=1 Tax=uncultured Amaricoccus sp. TaxID=339341 RepID=UPI00345D29A3